MAQTNPPPRSAPPLRNPLYIKIGKRIHQARLMARETNSRALSERMGWSGGRINNFETGISTPGVEETLQLCEALRVDPCWITYGVGSPCPALQQEIRHRNLMTVVDEAESAGYLPALLAATGLTVERLEKLRASPFKQVPDRLARDCEKYLHKPKNWLDQPKEEPLSPEAMDLLEVFGRLSSGDRGKLRAMAGILLGDPAIPPG
ncbi:MAG: hypothetical protein A2286_02505 [Gammaproteobacteria bacterium RIFOXYA12_FULL_61_12]|nr:MAG: hypothetical protein A2514_10310 [Gammaproteobacteria bacterium RIFOXYD12_FULL_61_37]OGT92925.1 MAG: hypothetical protein A2286_02505 [Gammaproteobacteria bacterium RIFOXYA12_FULL_61_12]